MVKKIISWKKFLSTTIGLAGIKLMSQNTGRDPSVPAGSRGVGKTGIMVSPICFGAPRTNEESLIRYAVAKANFEQVDEHVSWLGS